MKNYAPENASFLLPFQFDQVNLKKDLDKCLQFDFSKNYVPDNYQGKDYILPLRSIDGRLDFPVAAPNQVNRYKDTIALEQCAYFKEIIELFSCDKEAIRLMNLTPGQNVNTHTDYNCGYEDGIFRIHIPIITNEEVYFILNGERLIMNPGEAWYTNVNLPHSVANKGKTNRIHLVMDCIRNEWSDKLFESLGYAFNLEADVKEELPKSTMLLMIKELELQDTPGAKTLIGQLKERLEKK